MIRVEQVEGEPTRFHVESNSLECPGCKKLFTRLEAKNKSLRVESMCPACGTAKLDVRFHLVDVAEYWPVGRCGCEHWKFNLKKKIEKLSPDQLVNLAQPDARLLRCTHIEAARTAAIDVTLRAHEADRLRFAGGETEGNQP